MSKFDVKHIINSNILQYILLTIAVLVIWQVFYPGLMSPDSLAQYQQGVSGMIDDWHPPFMSVCVWVFTRLGGGIGGIILIQCFLALFGMRSAISLLVRFFSNQNVTKLIANRLATVITLLFLIPFLTPYTLFSVVFWKDAWLMILALWVISYFLWLISNLELLEKRFFIAHICLLSLLSVVLVLIRHNSIVMLPVFCLLITIISRQKIGNKGFALVGIPIIFAILLNPLIYFFFNIKHVYVSNTVLASDLATMLNIYPELSSKYKFTAYHKDSPVVLLTERGGVWNEASEGKPCPYLDKKICNPIMPLGCFGNSENTSNIEGNNCYMGIENDNKALKDEYFKAVVEDPIKLLKAKMHLFSWMLDSVYWNDIKVSCDITPNSLGLELNNNYTGLRENICYLNHKVAHQWYFNWISGIHFLWLILNIFVVVYFGVIFVFKRSNKDLVSLLLSLIPLSYYLSYILAATTPDYRFMYPSTLIMQAIFISLLTSKALFAYQKVLKVSSETNKELNCDREKSPEEKAEIVIEGLKGRSDSELCKSYNLDPQEYLKWRNYFLQNAPKIFEAMSNNPDE